MSGEIRAQVVIAGDAKGLINELRNSEKELQEFERVGKKVEILNKAIQGAKDARAALVEARAEAKTLDEQLAAAKGAGAGAEAIKLLEKALKDANREVNTLEKAWDKSKVTLDKARQAAAAAGIDTKNLAAEQGRLRDGLEAATAAVQRNAEAILQARQASIEKAAADRAVAAEEQRLAQIVETNSTRQRLAAQELLEAERKTYAEAEAAARRAATAREEEARAVELFAARTKKALADSFSAVGIRGGAEIQGEILKIQQSLMKLGANAKISGADFERAFAEAKIRVAALEAEMAGTVPAIDRMGAGAKGLKSEFSALTGQFVGLAVAMQAGSAFITANAGAESLLRTMTQLTGSTTSAAAELEYIRTVSNRLGINVQDAAKSYTQLIAATKGTAIEGEGARRVFEAVAGAMASLGKSSGETNNALMAINQMASKGTVQMEELKGQLGEALPGAMKAAANGAGLTVAELSKMVETGDVLAEDLLPALAKGLTEMYGVGKTENETFTASWSRLKNSVTETFQVIGDSGVFKALTQGIGGASQALGIFTVGMEASAKKVGVMAAAIANGDFGLKGFSDRAKLALGEIDAQTEASLAKITNSSKGAAAGLGEVGKAAEGAGKKASGASGDWLQMKNAFDEVERASKKRIDNLKTLADAHDAGAAAMKSFADTFGTQTEKLDAATNAAKEHEAALRTLSEQVKADLEISRSRLVALEQQRGADGKLTEAKEKLREELQKTIVAKQAEAEKTIQATAAAHSATLQAEASASVYADHAKQIYALRDAYQAAEAEYQRLAALNATGVSVAKELKAADEARAKALLLYRDALNDATAAAERHVTSERTAASLAGSALQNDKLRAETILEIAKQRGNEKEIAQAQIAVWRIELQINEAQAEAARKEAEAILLVAKAKRAELEASDALTPAKKAELEVMEASAKAKQLEAEKYDLLADRMKSLAYETKELKSSLYDLSDANGQVADSAGRAASSYDGLTTSIQRAAATRDGFVRDASGNVVEVATVDTKTASTRLQGLGVDQAVADQQARQFFDSYGNVQNTDGQSLDAALQSLAKKLTGTGQMARSSPVVQTVKVVQVDLRTSIGTQSIPVVGESAANALIQALQEARLARS
jgi:tape measure domain-containing protein